MLPQSDSENETVYSGDKIMPLKGKVPMEEKARIVEGYLAGKIRFAEASEKTAIPDLEMAIFFIRFYFISLST